MTMHVSQPGIDLIKHFEGVRLQRYVCPAGKPTIGVGHVILAGESFAVSITEQQAEELLRHDLADAERAVSEAVTVPLAQHEFDALVSLTFNIGEGAFRRSIALQRLNAGDRSGAAAGMLLWNRVKKKPVDGLTRRRQAEAELFLGGRE